MKQLFFFLTLFTFVACQNPSTNEQASNLTAEISTLKKSLQLEKSKSTFSPGLIHSVFFWLKKDLNKKDTNAFLKGVESLKAVKSVKTCYIGPPAPTEERGVVDNSYSYALIVHFENVAGQDAYQIDPIHLKFVEEHKDKWTKVVVYDNVVGE